MHGKSSFMLEDMRRQTLKERQERQQQLQQQSPRSPSFFAQFCMTRPKGDPRYDEIVRHWDDYFVVIPTGKTISDYIEIGDRVGTGSFGSVYKCSRVETSVPQGDQQQEQGQPKRQGSFWTCSAPDNASCDAYEFDPTKQEQQLCVKVIEKSSGNTLRARFGSKLLIAALAAKHPNITRYIQFLEDSHRMYIVMEFYTGPDLFDYIISNRPVSEEKAAFILEQISRATNFLHTQGGMHRDLKPENFMFQDDAQGAALKLVDFGSATSRNPYDPRTPMPMGSELEKRIMAEEERKQLEGECTIGTTEFSHSAKRIGSGTSSVGSTDTLHPRRSMSVVGTTGYCGPEVFTGWYDEKCDIFSAGVILFVMLTGEMPFECKNVDQYKNSLRRAQRCGLDKILCEYRGDRCANMSSEAKDLVFKMLELDPKKRPSAREVLEHPFIQKNKQRREMEENTVAAVEVPAAVPRSTNSPTAAARPASSSLNSSDVAPVRKEGPTFPSRHPDQWYLGGFFSSIFRKLDSNKKVGEKK